MIDQTTQGVLMSISTVSCRENGECEELFECERKKCFFSIAGVDAKSLSHGLTECYVN